MDDQETRTCRICAETIKRAARLCPYCHSDQRKSAILVIPPPWLTWVVWFVMLLVVLAGLAFAHRLFFSQGRDFAPFRDQFSIVSSSMEFGRKENGSLNVTTVGVVRNNSDYSWKEVQLEVRYFDRDGKLIDVGTNFALDLTVQSHSESAFRVRTFADQPKSAYASHKVFVRSAEDIRRWP